MNTSHTYTPEELLCKAAAYCAMAEHCAYDVRNKLQAWGCEEETLQTQIINYLYKEQYLSDERYARAFVNDKLRHQGWGRRKISLMLRQKQLLQDTINTALLAIDEELYYNILTDLLQKKARSLKKETDQQKRLKLLRFAASRGFEYAEIEEAISLME